MSYLYPGNIEIKLGFDVIRNNLYERCESSLGRQEVARMGFISEWNEIQSRLQQTSEMKRLLESEEDLPYHTFNDLETWLSSLRVEGSYASPTEFFQLRKTLLSFESVRKFFNTEEQGENENTKKYPYLSVLFSELDEYPFLDKKIQAIIDKDGNVKDSASPELAEVRQKLSGMQNSITRSVHRIFSAALKEGIVEKDTSPTFREGRMVIPVPAPHKRALRGIIHDESATGKTVFIEPAETVELSNRFRELQLEEQRIIIKILIALTEEIRPYIDEILSGNKLLGKMDFIMAKSRFAIDTNGDLPKIAKYPELDWYGAVHPVLLENLRQQGRSVVPLNIHLEGKERILMISGPNAGGKSVALKTVGIVQYMFQCGLLPTLYSNSRMGIFDKIFIDIGDEQSIENDLSTYSSHLKNMRHFLLHASKRTLVLIDEIGSGTEPNIGSSLAKAILEELSKSNCFGVITTHYHNLKKFAEETPGFINGAMLYDRQRLQPLFQLSQGSAGSSFALEIAGKIGLPKNVLDKAKEDVGEEYVESDKFLMEITRDRKYWQSKRASIKERESKLDQLEQKYEKIITELNQKRKEIIKEAQEEARQLLQGANKKIENTISEIRKIEAEKEKTKEIRKDLENFNKEIDSIEKEHPKLKNLIHQPKRRNSKGKEGKRNIDTNVSSAINKKKEFEIGDYVKLTGSSTTGKIISISGKEAEVVFGNLRTKVKVSKLQHSTKPSASQVTSSYTMLNSGALSEESSRRRQLEFKDEIDIRGMRADEALDRVTHFIDDALQFGIHKVRILHGTGHGILRQLVRQQLSATSGILKFEDEDVRMGGNGITVVTLG